MGGGGGCLLPKKELEETFRTCWKLREREHIILPLFSILGVILSPTLLVFTLAMK